MRFDLVIERVIQKYNDVERELRKQAVQAKDKKTHNELMDRVTIYSTFTDDLNTLIEMYEAKEKLGI